MKEPTIYYPEEDIQSQIPAGTDITAEATTGPDKKKQTEKSALLFRRKEFEDGTNCYNKSRRRYKITYREGYIKPVGKH